MDDQRSGHVRETIFRRDRFGSRTKTEDLGRGRAEKQQVAGRIFRFRPAVVDRAPCRPPSATRTRGGGGGGGEIQK